MKTKPVILLAFANDDRAEGAHLEHLKREQRTLSELFRPLEQQGLCDLAVLSFATLDDVAGAFRDDANRGRIAIFHFSGHAGSRELVLDSDSGAPARAHGEGFMPFLAGQPGLQFVFFNACFSQAQAERLTALGVPVVIGTLQAVDDRVAADLSIDFYRSVVQGRSIEVAWREAVALAVARGGKDDIATYYRPADEKKVRGIVQGFEDDRFPWEMKVRPGAEEALHWNVADATGNPTFGLPALPDRYRLPDEPYRFLQRYEARDAAVFFGRGRYVRDLYQAIVSAASAPVIRLYGQSGVGKSSLLQAGLLPRLEASHEVVALQRRPGTGLPAALAGLFGLGLPEPSAGGESLRTAWLAREKQSGRPLVVLADQLEAVFMEPYEQEPRELNLFFTALAGIFADASARPQGKIVLGYRKEFSAEIEQALREAYVENDYVYLKKLDRDDIVEVVRGLRSTPRHIEKYQLDVEENLPVIIADDLLADRDSPVAPVLQIILSRLWKQEHDRPERHFRVGDYQELAKKGILLTDFFDEQMAAIRAWEATIEKNAGIEETGLALDILHYHTTEFGTSHQHRLEELQEMYQHRADVLERLIHKFTELYLLAETDSKALSLAHDALGPIIHTRVRHSDRPGQRALRILEAKATEYQLNADETFIDSTDLRLVRSGREGMRRWQPEEEALYEKSRLRNRQHRMLRIAALSLLVIGSIVIGLLQYQGARRQRALEIGQLYTRGRLEAAQDPTRGLALVRQAVAADPLDLAKRQGAYEVYAGNVLYETMTNYAPGCNSAAFAADGRLFVVASGDSLLWFRPGQDAPLVSAEAGNTVTSVWIEGRDTLFAASEDQKIWVYFGAQRLAFTLDGAQAGVTALAASAGGRRLAALQSDGSAALWDVGTQQLVRQLKPEGAITSLALSADGNTLVYALEDGHIDLAPWPGPTTAATWPARGGQAVTALALAPSGTAVVVGYDDGLAALWQRTAAGAWTLADSQRLHSREITRVVYAPDGRLVLTASADQTARVLGAGDFRPRFRLLGHAAPLHSARFSADSDTVWTADAAGSVRRWALPYPFTEFARPTGLIGAARLFFSADGRRLALYSPLDTVVEVRDGATLYSVLRFAAHRAPVTAAAVANDNRTAASGDQSGLVQRWDLLNGTARTAETLFASAIRSLALSADGVWLLASAEEDSVAVLSNGVTPKRLAQGSAVSAVAFVEGGRYGLTAGLDSSLTCWTIPDGRQEGSIRLTSTVISLEPDAIGQGFFVLTSDGRAQHFERWGATPEPRGVAQAIDWAADGSWYAALHPSGYTVEIYSTEGFLIQQFEPVEGRLQAIAVEPSGRRIVAIDASGSLSVWKVRRRPLFIE
jgi:WD40 repeat protein